MLRLHSPLIHDFDQVSCGRVEIREVRSRNSGGVTMSPYFSSASLAARDVLDARWGAWEEMYVCTLVARRQLRARSSRCTHHFIASAHGLNQSTSPRSHSRSPPKAWADTCLTCTSNGRSRCRPVTIPKVTHYHYTHCEQPALHRGQSASNRTSCVPSSP